MRLKFGFNLIEDCNAKYLAKPLQVYDRSGNHSQPIITMGFMFWFSFSIMAYNEIILCRLYSSR